VDQLPHTPSQGAGRLEKLTGGTERRRTDDMSSTGTALLVALQGACGLYLLVSNVLASRRTDD
jgi:hypothetical protein